MAAAGELRAEKGIQAGLGHVQADQPRAHGDGVGVIVLAGQRRGEGRYRLAGGGGAILNASDPLAAQDFLAIADLDPARAAALAKTTGADLHSANNYEIIERPEVTAVFVSTPEGEHAAPIKRALELGKPVLVSSGYRSPAVNRAVGGAANSAHMLGCAADFSSPSFGSPLDICRAIARSDIAFDQLIHEFRAWVHIAWAPQPRKMVLTIDAGGTRAGLS